MTADAALAEQQVTAESIPEALRVVPRWLCWRWETREGKPDKPPRHPVTGKKIDVTRKANLVPFATALEYVGRFDGIGFALGEGFAGIDLDDCFAADGQPYNWARYILEDFAGTYAEVSPSGNGIKLFLRGSKPGDACKRELPGGSVEVYDHAHYFTVTGQRYNGAAAEVQYRERELHALHVLLFPPEEPRAPVAPPRPVEIADADLIAKAMAAKNGSAFAALWNGDTSAHGGDDSRADLALCSHLAFWTGGDAARIDGLFRQSGLYREKWERADYREGTIAKALEGATEFYTLPATEEPLAPPVPVEAEVRALEPSTWTSAAARAAELSWLWPDWVPDGQPTVVAGDTGMGKTWFALALAGSVIEGWPWPDGTPGLAGPGRVFWLEGEGRLRLNFSRACGMGIDTDGFLGMPDPWRAYYLDDADHFDGIAAMVRHTKPRLVVCDSWNRCYRGKENDAEVRHTLDAVTRLAEETNTPWLLLQHVRKPTLMDDTEVFDIHTIRGSGALVGAACAVIGLDMVRGTPDVRRVSCAKSNMAETYPEPLGFSLREGKVYFGAAPEAATRPLKHAETILAALAGSDGLTPTDCANSTGVNRGTAYWVLQTLCTQGKARQADGRYYSTE
jgi:putative DNA primase/helicase